MRKTSSFPSQTIKFLIDENVRRELSSFLKREGYDVTLVPKGTTDSRIAKISKSEKRVLITNDGDFADLELYTQDLLFAVIWLRVPQSDKNGLLKSFHTSLREYKDKYEGKLFMVEVDSWEMYPFGEVEQISN